MRRSLKILAVISLTAFAPLSATAQGVMPFNPGIRSGQVPDGYISVQSGISLSLPLKDDGNVDDQIKSAQKTLYGLASGSCASALETIADDCNISFLSTNVDMNQDVRSAKIMVRSQITMIMKLKAATAK
jgi:hypothetical protein